MSRKEILTGMSVKELREYAASIGVKNTHKYRKAELVEKTVETENLLEQKEEKEAERIIQNSGTVLFDSVRKNECCVNEKTEREHEKNTGDVHEKNERRLSYIENAKPGMIVAFALSNGAVKSAKIIKKSTVKRRFMLETNYGEKHIVSYDSILWVKTGKLWPSGIYKLFKGKT